MGASPAPRERDRAMNDLHRFASFAARTVAIATVDALLAAGMAIRVHDGGAWAMDEHSTDRQAILDALASTGEDTLFCRDADGHRRGSAVLIYENDGDALSDYSMSLAHILDPVITEHCLD